MHFLHPATSLTSLGSLIFAKAITELFPHVQLGACSIDPPLFEYEIVFNHPFPPEMLPMVEEKMRSIIKDQPTIRRIEMLPKIAAAYFSHIHQYLKAEESLAYEEEEQLIPLYEIDQFKDICFEEAALHTKNSYVKILDFRTEGNQTLFVGTAATNPQEIKDFVKKYKTYQKMPRPSGFFGSYQGEEVILPKGTEIYQKMVADWQAQIRKEGFRLFQTPPDDDPGFFAQWILSEEQTSLPAKYATFEEGDHAYTFCSYEQLPQELNYSLQFLEKTLMMLPFECQWILLAQRPKNIPKLEWDRASQQLEEALKRSGLPFESLQFAGTHGPRLQGVLIDPLGRYRPGPVLEVECSPRARSRFLNPSFKTLEIIRRTMFDSLEQYVALLVEWQKRIPPQVGEILK